MLLSQRLKELRAAKGLSQAALADILGRTQQAIGKWEVGRSEPDGATLLKLAAYFNVTTDYLLGLTDTPTTPAGSPAMDSSAPGGTQGSAEGADEQPPQQKEYVELHRIIDNLSHEDVKELLNSARYKQNLADKKREYVDDPDDF